MDTDRLEPVPNGTVHLDTVRALHQTVVSLRTALEVSKNELKELKEKYENHARCNDFADVIEKLTIENHILRRKINDSEFEEHEPIDRNIKLEVTYSPQLRTTKDYNQEVFIESATTNVNTFAETLESDVEEEFIEQPANENIVLTENYNENKGEDINSSYSYDGKENSSQCVEEESTKEESQIITLTQNSEETDNQTFKTKLELLSKFDVRIKVKTIKEGAIFSSSTSDTDSIEEKNSNSDRVRSKPSFQFGQRNEHFENAEDLKGNKINFKTVSTENLMMAVPSEADSKSKVDKFDVQVRITSEENLIVKENVERSRRKDTLNLDVDDLSIRSLSEGDNSVFSESGVTPAEPSADVEPEDKQEQENSGNESEEVDDIELIFTTDESKDISNLQEDLVSIQETDQWVPSSASTHSTPVLIKFHTIDADFEPSAESKDSVQNENQEKSGLQNIAAESSLRMKRVSLPSDKEIRHVAFNGKGSLELPGRGILKAYENKSDNMLYKKSPNTSTKRLDSIDSLTCEYNRGLSFDNTKSSSFELGSSMDILHREESVDSFHRPHHHLGHRFSVFAETDISKCGISEDDLAANLNVRRNTCPNPFQYRPLAQRNGSRVGVYGMRGRGAGGGATRSAAAQTDVCALPARCRSDPHLARQMSLPVAAPAPPPRPPPAARALLSDIGFTSMVPELSRSADPVWALSRLAQESPSSTSTAKFLSRGSTYRSPCLSIDRSNDWIPQSAYPTQPKLYGRSRPWRSSLPDVRDDTLELVEEAEAFLRRSIDNLCYCDTHRVSCTCAYRESNIRTSSGGPVVGGGPLGGKPYIPREPRSLRLGHAVKIIAPNGRLLIGRVRYIGLAGGTAATSSMVVGGEFPDTGTGAGLPRNDGTYKGRRYFLTQPHYNALFVPFSKVVMAWAN